MDDETREKMEMWMEEERVDETWRRYHESLGNPRIKLSDLDPEIIELIVQKAIEKIEAKKFLKEELEWLANNPEYSW
jgi:hypothetical protein